MVDIDTKDVIVGVLIPLACVVAIPIAKVIWNLINADHRRIKSNYLVALDDLHSFRDLEDIYLAKIKEATGLTYKRAARSVLKDKHGRSISQKFVRSQIELKRSNLK